MTRASIAAFAFAAAAALSGAGAAGAVRIVSQPEGAYETLLADVVLPGGTAGYVILRPCGGCERISLRVTSATAWSVDGTAVPFAELIAAAEGLRGADGGADTAVYVYYDIASGLVNRLALDRLGD
ncbi:MAG: hypothetical protein JXB36_08585 [Gammaproteobacteria bacterium]|nr:hypothetical protein [Gammaproteobacteria bacterium]